MTFKLVLVIVNAGFCDDVMSAAREVGAKGGTIINARGTARQEAESLFNIAVQKDKEVVFIVAAENIVDKLLHNIYQKVGLSTPGQGIALTLDVDEFVKTKQPKKDVQEEDAAEN